MSHSSDIIKHYVDKNLEWPDLQRAVLKHARLLATFDPQVALALETTPLRAQHPKLRKKR